MGQILSEINPVQALIGTLTYDNIVSASFKLQGVKTEDMATHQTVANNNVPVSITDHPKEIIVTIVVDAQNILQDLITAGYYTGGTVNSVLGVLKVKEQNGKNQSRVVTFNGASAKIQTVETRFVNENNPVTEVKILTSGTIIFDAWPS